MSDRDIQRLDDLEAACLAIQAHTRRGPLDDELILDATCMRLLEIGEITKALSPALLATEPDIPWRQIARMRDHLAHHYFATEVPTVQQVVDRDIAPLLAATRRIAQRLHTVAEE